MRILAAVGLSPSKPLICQKDPPIHQKPPIAHSSYIELLIHKKRKQILRFFLAQKQQEPLVTLSGKFWEKPFLYVKKSKRSNLAFSKYIFVFRKRVVNDAISELRPVSNESSESSTFYRGIQDFLKK